MRGKSLDDALDRFVDRLQRLEAGLILAIDGSDLGRRQKGKAADGGGFVADVRLIEGRWPGCLRSRKHSLVARGGCRGAIRHIGPMRSGRRKEDEERLVFLCPVDEVDDLACEYVG